MKTKSSFRGRSTIPSEADDANESIEDPDVDDDEGDSDEGID